MGNPYAAQFTDTEGEVRLEGEIDFTDGGNQPGNGGLSGSGSPLGAVDATFPGQQYTDVVDGGLYMATAVGNTHWVQVAGPQESVIAGVASTSTAVQLITPSGNLVDVGSAAIQISVNETAGIITLGSFIGDGVQVTDNGTHTELGFYAQTPVAQQAGAGITTVAELVTALQALGLLG